MASPRKRKSPPPTPAFEPVPSSPGTSPDELLTRFASRLLADLGPSLPAPTLEVMRSQAAALGSHDTPSVERPPTQTRRIIQRVGDLDTVRQQLDTADLVAIDVLGSGKDALRSEVVGFAVGDKTIQFYVPIGHRDVSTSFLVPDQLPAGVVVARLGLERRPLLTHDGKRLVHLLGLSDFDLRWDTAIASQLMGRDDQPTLMDIVRSDLDGPYMPLQIPTTDAPYDASFEVAAAFCIANCRVLFTLMEKQQQCAS